MTLFEYLISRKEYCEGVAASSKDSRIAEFHAKAAQVFEERAMRLTLAEASRGYRREVLLSI